MNELKLLNEQEVLGKQFKVYGTPDNPLFVAKDGLIMQKLDKGIMMFLE